MADNQRNYAEEILNSQEPQPGNDLATKFYGEKWALAKLDEGKKDKPRKPSLSAAKEVEGMYAAPIAPHVPPAKPSAAAPAPSAGDSRVPAAQNPAAASRPIVLVPYGETSRTAAPAPRIGDAVRPAAAVTDNEAAVKAHRAKLVTGAPHTTENAKETRLLMAEALKNGVPVVLGLGDDERLGNALTKIAEDRKGAPPDENKAVVVIQAGPDQARALGLHSRSHVVIRDARGVKKLDQDVSTPKLRMPGKKPASLAGLLNKHITDALPANTPGLQ